MLLRLTKSFRVKAAMAMAALYAFCILLPATAFALADGRLASPCLIDDLAALSAHDHAATDHGATAHHHGGASHDHAGHDHAATMAHHHHGDEANAASVPQGDPDHSKGRPGECCGLFPMVALAGGLRPALAPPRLTSSAISAPTEALTGRGPDRIIRPPIA
jgi:hypothetical protein